MMDTLRTSLHRVITTPFGDRYLPVRVPKDLARRVNALFGEPLCSQTELDRRRAGRASLAALAKTGGDTKTASARPAAQAPVMVYYESERNHRGLARLREKLDGLAITYTLLDVGDDEVTRDFVLREARCKSEELPVVFIAGAPVGPYDALVDWNTSGRLAKALAGD